MEASSCWLLPSFCAYILNLLSRKYPHSRNFIPLPWNYFLYRKKLTFKLKPSPFAILSSLSGQAPAEAHQGVDILKLAPANL
jgi:hypothetical protein